MNYMIGLKAKLDNTDNKTVVLQERPFSNGVDGHNPFIRMTHSVIAPKGD